jgi:hypothetical protein
MSTSTVRISESTHRLLQEIAKQSGQTMTDVLAKALDTYRRQIFFEKLNAGYAELRASPEAWTEMEMERKQMETTLMDGLVPDEEWNEEGRCVAPRRKRKAR